jgi:AcrR family transcriptional regulator
MVISWGEKMSVDRKKQIVDAANRSFSLFGYKATTMDQVAKMANVGKGTIYNFFTNKEELFDEIVSSLIAEMQLAAEEAIDSHLSFSENTHRALFRILEFRKEHQLTIKLFQEERDMGTPEVMDVLRKLEHTIISYISEKIRKAINRREIKECNPELTAFIMLKIYIALIFDWEQQNRPFTKEEVSTYFELYLFKGLSL